jgi:hypothetical protein
MGSNREPRVRRIALSAVSIAAAVALATPAAAATCKCQKNYSPFGAPLVGSHQMVWECVRKPGAHKRGQHPAPFAVQRSVDAGTGVGTVAGAPAAVA